MAIAVNIYNNCHATIRKIFVQHKFIMEPPAYKLISTTLSISSGTFSRQRTIPPSHF